MYDFNDRVLVLTGANGGIGRETAKLFYEHGAQLVLADVDEKTIGEFGATLDPTGKRVATMAMNAADAKDAEKAVKLACDRFGGIDFVVPSAGVYWAHPVREMQDEQWRKLLSINLDGPFFICQRAIPALRENSAIVHVSSMAAHRGSFYNAHYSASKGALVALTRSLARELGPKTRVNAVSPGVIETPMTVDLIQRRGAESVEQTPLQRLGHPREIATAIGFLCSGAASFITGEVLQVNGGLYISG